MTAEGPSERAPGETVVSTIRHGLTELNRDQRVGGRLDVPLLEAGREQARQAGAVFTSRGVDVVVVSPLRRAIETAELVTHWRRSSFEIDELCTERSFGEMEGIDPAEVPTRFPMVEYLRIEDIGYSLNPPGGETFEELHERAHRFVDGLIARHAGRSIVVFSHQNFLQQMHAVLRAMGPKEALEYDILNCELNEFRLGADRGLLDHRVRQLVASAGDHASF
ncbi:MAG: histidine phosphatase family protein [Actinomycetota bacterium]|nr:histidine phosphatase family protein [Actinomycetota bacterium]